MVTRYPTALVYNNVVNSFLLLMLLLLQSQSGKTETDSQTAELFAADGMSQRNALLK